MRAVPGAHSGGASGIEAFPVPVRLAVENLPGRHGVDMDVTLSGVVDEEDGTVTVANTIVAVIKPPDEEEDAPKAREEPLETAEVARQKAAEQAQGAEGEESTPNSDEEPTVRDAEVTDEEEKKD